MKTLLITLLINQSFFAYSMDSDAVAAETLELNHKLFKACLGPARVDKEASRIFTQLLRASQALYQADDAVDAKELEMCTANLTEVSSLLDQKADVNALCTTGPLDHAITPLMQTLYGCHTGKENRISLLLNKRANVEAADANGDPAFAHALRQYISAPMDQQGGYFRIIQSLVKAGSKVTDDALTMLDQFVDHTETHPFNNQLRELLLSAKESQAQ